ncbi:MAG: DVU_1557 family redox protein [Desulfobacterales bacterium]
MKIENAKPEDQGWQCDKCDAHLVIGPVSVTYMGNRFTTDMPHCPACGMVLVTEELAMGKMAEVEQILEDK